MMNQCDDETWSGPSSERLVAFADIEEGFPEYLRAYLSPREAMVSVESEKEEKLLLANWAHTMQALASTLRAEVQSSAEVRV